ncbi:MAG: type II toxin-antitoxin system Phd/YefM family antitoxin [Treponema sp.]|jgi:antitoxin YefM|nr:type II toxin-antitoxin system Phd/YefM family antitoxin [Treponema sp.]
MIALKAADVRNNFKNVCNLVAAGEPVIIPRPKNENIVLISEKRLSYLEKLEENIEYEQRIKAALDNLNNGGGLSFEMKELEAFEAMSAEEIKAYVFEKKGHRL